MKANSHRAAKWVAFAIGLVALPSATQACFYHWALGLPEPVGIWPTATDATSALAALQAQDASDDAAVSLTTGTLSSPSYLSTSQTDSATDPTITSWIINTNGACGQSSVGFDNAVVRKVEANVQLVAYTSTDVYIHATGIPSQVMGSFGSDRTIPSNANRTVVIPRVPVVQSGPKTSIGFGAIGVAVNGVSFSGPWDSTTYNNAGVWQENALVAQASTFDSGSGRTVTLPKHVVATPIGPDSAGAYSYYSAPNGLINEVNPGNTGQVASGVIGYAFDGIPIFGPYGYKNADGTGGVVLMTSSYELRDITTRTTLPDGMPAPTDGPAVSALYPLGTFIQDYQYVAGSGTLDQYNGRFAVAPGYPNGVYGYYVTETSAGAPVYPYVVGPDYYGEMDPLDVGARITVPSDVTFYAPQSVPEPSALATFVGPAVLLMRRRRSR